MEAWLQNLKTFGTNNRQKLVANYPHIDLVLETMQAFEETRGDKTFYRYTAAAHKLKSMGVLSLTGKALNTRTLISTHNTISQELTPTIQYPLSTECFFPQTTQNERLTGIPFFDTDLDGRLDFSGYMRRTK